MSNVSYFQDDTGKLKTKDFHYCVDIDGSGEARYYHNLELAKYKHMENKLDRHSTAFGSGSASEEVWKVGRYAFTRTVPEGTPDSVAYSYTDSKTNERVTRYRLEENSIGGRVYSGEWEDTDFGRYCVLNMFDHNGTYKLRFKVGNPKKFLEENFVWFAKKVGGIDPSETIMTSFYLGENRKSDRTRQDNKGNTVFPSMLLIDVDGLKVGSQFREGGRELPAWEKREEDDGFGKTKVVWDAFEHNKALIAEVITYFEKLKAANISVPKFATAEPTDEDDFTPSEPTPPAGPEIEDEIPF